MHRAHQAAAYHEAAFRRQIPQLLRTRRIDVGDKQFDYDGHAVRTRFVLPNGDVERHLACIVAAVIAQVGQLHPSYRSVSWTRGSFGAAHTRVELEVRLQNHKAGVLSLLAGFLVRLGWDLVPYDALGDRRLPPDRSLATPRAVHLLDLKTHRDRLVVHACEYARRAGAVWVETSRDHVHVHLTVVHEAMG